MALKEHTQQRKGTDIQPEPKLLTPQLHTDNFSIFNNRMTHNDDQVMLPLSLHKKNLYKVMTQTQNYLPELLQVCKCSQIHIQTPSPTDFLQKLPPLKHKVKINHK